MLWEASQENFLKEKKVQGAITKKSVTMNR